jgi:hypothetical protein
MFSVWDDVISQTRLMQDALSKGDQRAMAESSQQVLDSASSLRGKAGAYGFHECGSA